MVKRLKHILSIVSLFTLIWVINVNADYTKLKDVVNDSSGSLYRSAYDLLIEKDDLPYLNSVDFNRFNDLVYITLDNVYLENGKLLKLSPNDQINTLYINNSIVNMTTFDLTTISRVKVYDSFDLGSTMYNKVNYGTGSFLNEEYSIDPQYDAKINEVAKEIYNKSNKTVKDIIKKTTLYVIDNITYDDDWLYEDLSLNESIFEKKMGVCEHYAHLESQILNKLGIMTMNVVGYTDKNNPDGTVHAWNIVAIDGKWYSIDPTWLDVESRRQDLINNKDNKYYLKPLSDATFNSDHITYFTNFNNIPKSSRISKISIANPIKTTTTTTTSSQKPTKTAKAAPKLENPETGAFISFIALILAYLLARGMLYVSKKKTVLYRI